jgi:PKD repeat protein
MKFLNNKIKSSVFASLILLFTLISACKKDNTVRELGPAPTAEQVKFTATPTTANANVLSFKNESLGFKAIWDFGNGTTGEGNTVTAGYPMAGTYTVKLTIVTDGGYATNSKTITIAQTNPAMLTDPAFELISGGLSNASGKTWIIDQGVKGHLGITSSANIEGEWWYQAGPNEKEGAGFYDDEMIFNMNSLKYTYANNGTTFANAANAPGIGGPTGSSDPTVAYTPANNLTWLVTVENGVKYITISNNGFIGYYLGVSKYQILALTADEMYLRCLDKSNAGNAWYMKLIRKGFTRPVVPPVQKPLQGANLSDDFDLTSNFTWSTENITFKRSYDNPNPFPVNISSKVAYYEKKTGDEGQYGNLNVTLPYRFDLKTKNKIKLKVFIPAANDFTKVKSTVAIKLQNSLLGGNAWTTQKEIVKTITADQYNKWITLEFDYLPFADETLYDKIVLQLGGEGHPNPGIFYIDDFEFK